MSLLENVSNWQVGIKEAAEIATEASTASREALVQNKCHMRNNEKPLDTIKEPKEKDNVEILRHSESQQANENSPSSQACSSDKETSDTSEAVAKSFVIIKKPLNTTNAPEEIDVDYETTRASAVPSTKQMGPSFSSDIEVCETSDSCEVARSSNASLDVDRSTASGTSSAVQSPCTANLQDEYRLPHEKKTLDTMCVPEEIDVDDETIRVSTAPLTKQERKRKSGSKRLLERDSCELAHPSNASFDVDGSTTSCTASPVPRPSMTIFQHESRLSRSKKPVNTANVPEEINVDYGTKRYSNVQLKRKKGSWFSSGKEICEVSNVLRKSFGVNGYIEGKWRGNRLLELDSCQFTHPFNSKTAYIRKQSSGYLFTFDQDNFILRVNIDKIEDLNFGMLDSNVEKKLLEKLEITNVIEDELLNERGTDFQKFQQLLQERRFTTASNLEHAEDLFQLFKRLENWKRYSSNSAIYNDILRNRNFSSDLNTSAKKLFNSEKTLGSRIEEFPKLSQIYAMDLKAALKQICKEAIENHRKILLKKYFEIISVIAPTAIPDHLSKLNDDLVFLITVKDIELFADLVDMMKETPFLDFAVDVWNAFFKRVDKLGRDMRGNSSLKHLLPLTNPIYFFLCKCFKELVLEINSKTNISFDDLLQKNADGKWVLIETITWPTDCPLNNALEQQYRFIFIVMKHFQPGYYSHKKKLDYKLKVLKDSEKIPKHLKKENSALPDERLVWVYILDNAIENLISEKEFELFEPLIEGFSNFANDTNEDNYETFRVAALNEIKFIAQTSPYLSKGASETILQKQMESIRKVCLDRNSDDFKDLVDVFNEFWKNRQSILEEIPKKFPCEDFEDNMAKICQTLLDIANIALDKQTNSKEIIKYFRSFNEFLEDSNNLDFAWFIKKEDIENCIPKHYSSNVLLHLKLVNEDKKSYQVFNPEGFIHLAKKMPKHYAIEILQDLLNTVVKFLKQNKWSDEDNLNATSELLSAIKKSLLYLKEQPYYVSFDLFKKESTEAFFSVVENSNSYEDFQKRICIVGESLWYLRRQDEIDLEKALELYKGENNDNLGTYDTLKSCYDKYLEKFSFYIEETLNLDFEEKIDFITKEVKTTLAIISENEQIKINDWDTKLKKETLPKLLAGLAAVWSIQESKDISSTGKILKPHCIQILCILRLLSVDKDSKGVDKHLAQVLTGQGKSLVLGLLSTLLALLGYQVRMVCYSEYLATRDEQDFKSFFKSFGVHDKINYGTFVEMANEVLEPEVNGKKQGLRELVAHRILNQSEEQVGLIGHKYICNTILLIDEVDVFFSDEFYGNIYNAGTFKGFQALAIIQEKIWANRHTDLSTIITRVKELIAEKIRERNECFIEFNEFLNEWGRYNLLKRENNAVVLKGYTNQSLFNEHLELMVASAISVAGASDQDWFINKFKINDEGIISGRKNDGMYYTTAYWGYYNTFNYFRLKKNEFDTKLFKNYGYLNIDCGSVSYAKLPEKYPLILGVSGTLTTLHEHEKKAVKHFYNINKSSIMPSFFGDSHLKFDSIQNFSAECSQDDWLNKIFRQANSQIISRRSVIIFFDTDIEMDKFQEKYHGKFDRLRTLTLNTDKMTKEKYINEAGITRTVTLATRGMGRGVDYKSSVAVEKNGGVHVIQTFFSLDIKEETQIKGRTARKDCKGSYELIVCKEHLTKAGFLQTDDTVIKYESLNQSRKQKMQQKGLKDVNRIEKSELDHKTTMDYLESFFERKFD